MKKCPYCAEEVQDDAQICKWCHSDLTEPVGHQEHATPETSGKATASMILGFFFFVFPAAVLAVVFGHLARWEIRRSGGRLKGSGRALTGLILGYSGVSVIPVLIIAAIAIPNLLRAKMAANEASAVGSLRTISTAAATYAATYGRGFPRTLRVLGPPAGGIPPGKNGADLIDGVLAEGSRSGYSFQYQAFTTRSDGLADVYTVNADPVTPGTTGQRHFFTDQTGVIRFETNGPANENSPPIS